MELYTATVDTLILCLLMAWAVMDRANIYIRQDEPDPEAAARLVS